MKRQAIIAAGFALLASPVAAADDPIAVRQALMSSNGAAAGIAGGVMKGELDYNPVIGRSAIATMNAVALSVGDFFPEGSADPERSRAAPRIWEDMPGFQAALEEFRAAAASATETSGRDGPPDAAAFTAAVQPVLETCQNCHETYRLEE